MSAPASWKPYLQTSRVYSSAVFIPLFIAVLALAPKWLFFLLLTGAMALALNELWWILCPGESRKLQWLMFALSFALVASSCR
jgi:hypothetical protein